VIGIMPLHAAESLDRSNLLGTMGTSVQNRPTEEQPMTTIKRLLRRLDGYTLEAFNSPGTLQRRRPGRHAVR
jgi:hypothetical protein